MHYKTPCEIWNKSKISQKEFPTSCAEFLHCWKKKWAHLKDQWVYWKDQTNSWRTTCFHNSGWSDTLWRSVPLSCMTLRILDWHFISVLFMDSCICLNIPSRSHSMMKVVSWPHDAMWASWVFPIIFHLQLHQQAYIAASISTIRSSLVKETATDPMFDSRFAFLVVPRMGVSHLLPLCRTQANASQFREHFFFLAITVTLCSQHIILLYVFRREFQ
jgi:hypothetical protein